MSETSDLAHERHFVRPSAPKSNKRTLERLSTNRNNVVAYHMLKSMHPILADPRYFQELAPETQGEIAYLRGLAFDGYYPDAEDLSRVHSTLRLCGSTTREKLINVLTGIDDLVEAQHLKWHDEEPELVRMYQDTRVAMHNLPHDMGGRVVTFGSARTPPGTPIYEAAKWLNRTLVTSTMQPDGTTEQGIGGAGPGVMEAGSLGLMQGRLTILKRLYERLQEAGESGREEIMGQIINARMQLHSIGIRINLPFEAGWNEHLQLCLTMKHFGPRKEALVATTIGRSVEHNGSENHHKDRHPAVFVFEGGFGSHDELWEAATLVQCRKMPAVPIIAVGKGVRHTLRAVIDDMHEQGTISPDDDDIIVCCEDEREALERYLAYYELQPDEEAQAEIAAYEPVINTDITAEKPVAVRRGESTRPPWQPSEAVR